MDRGIHRECRGDDEQRITVRRRFRDEIGADDAVGAGAVVDHALLAETFGEFLTHETAEDVVAAAGRKRHDDAHRPRRKTSCGLGLRGACAGHGECRERAHRGVQGEQGFSIVFQ